MPKKYPVEVRLFAIQKKMEGHSWDRVAEMLKQNFSLDSAPSRRQMTKWVTKNSVPDVVMKEINHRLPAYGPEWLSTHQDALAKVVAEGMRGKDFGILMAKWVFSQMKAMLGPQRLTTAWAEFTGQEEQPRQASSPSQSYWQPFPFYRVRSEDGTYWQINQDGARHQISKEEFEEPLKVLGFEEGGKNERKY
jgi:hypothetical protein